jgi:hypothetical protein
MEDHVNRHVEFFNSIDQIPAKLDMQIINQLQSMANSGEFLDNLVQSTSPRLQNTKVAGKLRVEIQQNINNRLNEIIDFIKNPKESLQEQERIKDLMTK